VADDGMHRGYIAYAGPASNGLMTQHRSLGYGQTDRERSARP